MPYPAPAHSSSSALGSAGNLRGIAAMVAANALLSANDACLKLASSTLPTGELVFIRNGIGVMVATVVVLAMRVAGGLTLLPPGLLAARTVLDIGGSLLFILSLVALPFADAVAIGQCLPLVITAFAALFLREPVGWRRWLATGVGFLGVLMIIRPGTTAFTPASLLGLASVLAIAARDLVTRRVPPQVSALMLALMSLLMVALSSLGFLAFETWRWPNLRELALLAAAGTLLFAGYVLLVVAVRTGEVAAVVPFRYTLVIWAILGGWLLWGELPDALTMTGTGVVVAAGLYTLHREQVRRRQALGR